MKGKRFAKKKILVAKRSILIVGEGKTEKEFISFLKKIYSTSQVSIRIKSGAGGSPDSVVQYAIRQLGAYDLKVVILDNDRSEIKKAEKIAKQKDIHLIKITPCIEGLLLSILSNGKSYASKSCKWCKNQLASKLGIDPKDIPTKVSFEHLFNREVLENARNTIAELNEIISILENNFNNFN